MTNTKFLLTLSCPNQPGIVAKVATELFAHGANILEAHQFDDTETGKFFMRIVFNFVKSNNIEGFLTGFNPIAKHYGMTWGNPPLD